MILVVGATGLLGGHITRTLLERGEPVRILVRTGSDFDALVSAGADPVVGDLKDPDSLRVACAGIDTVVTTANSLGRGGRDTVESVDRVGNGDLVDAAVAMGVRRFVFISSLGADAEHPTPFLRAKGETEQRLRASGMAWTVLQPDFFMDLWVGAVVAGPVLAGRPVTLVGNGRRRHSMVAARDVAGYAIAALDHPEAQGRTLIIGGPEPMTWRTVVAAFEQELGRDVPVRTIGPGEPVPGLPDVMSGLLAALDTYDSPLDMTELSNTFGVTPTTLADFVNNLVATSRQHVS